MSVKQASAPVPFDTTRRMDNASILSSGRAGVVQPVSFSNLHRGDSASGRVTLQVDLAEMPKPLENAVIARVQAWCIPRPALPQFAGIDEYTHAYHGKAQTVLNGATRDPAPVFDVIDVPLDLTNLQTSDFFRALGLSLQPGVPINSDYIDSYNLVQNFRLNAFTTKIPRYPYAKEDLGPAAMLKPAIWPPNRMHNIVPDYERALVMGALELDVSAGNIPLRSGGTSRYGSGTYPYAPTAGDNVQPPQDADGNSDWTGQIWADMRSTTVITTLADIDKARTTNAFAKRQTAYAGTDFSGFNNDDVIVADLMQGFTVPESLFNRPWVLDSKTVTFGMSERFSTSTGALDESVSVGSAVASLSINVPKQEYGAIIMVTVEVMPERLYPRQRDEYLHTIHQDSLPNALRDIQRTEPVDIVDCGRIDTLHTTAATAYGFEPMNAKERKERTTMGGDFRQLTPGTPNDVARTAIWQPDYVDPAFTSDHWLCPYPFPQNVFSVTDADCFDVSANQQITIVGHTQFGDELVEDNQEMADLGSNSPT